MELTNLEKALDAFAKDMNLRAKRELGTKRIGKNKSYGKASGELQRALSYEVRDGKIRFFAGGKAGKYARYIHEGVNGTQRDRGSIYSYKNKRPPTDAILEWMRVKPIRLRDETGAFIKQTPEKMKAAAIAISTAIQRNGIYGLKYYELAFDNRIPRHRDKLAEAGVEDITEFIRATTIKLELNGPNT